MLQKLLNLEWQITSKSFLLSSFLVGFSFSPTAEISMLELEFEEGWGLFQPLIAGLISLLFENSNNFDQGEKCCLVL